MLPEAEMAPVLGKEGLVSGYKRVVALGNTPADEVERNSKRIPND